MKNIFISTAIILLSHDFSHASHVKKDFITETSWVHRHIVRCIVDNLDSGKGIPTTLDNIPSLRETVESEPWMIKKINILALVPEAPLIRAEQNVKADYHGYRLFAVGRTTNFDYERTSLDGKLESGRYTILFASDGRSAIAPWIPESEVKAILSQIKDFEPAKQPLAFQDLVQAENKSKKHRPTEDERDGKSEGIQNSSVADSVGRVEENRWLWIIGGVLITVLLISIKIRKRKQSL
jgi:hypothetical protein